MNIISRVSSAAFHLRKLRFTHKLKKRNTPTVIRQETPSTKWLFAFCCSCSHFSEAPVTDRKRFQLQESVHRSRNRHSQNRTERDQTQRLDNRWASRLKTKQQKVRESIVHPPREAPDKPLTLEMICMKNHQMKADQITPVNRDKNDSSSRIPRDPANIWKHQMNQSICFRDSRLAHFTTNSIPVRLLSNRATRFPQTQL